VTAVNRAPEYIKGISEPLPPGEHLLWQGAPEWTALARRALHLRKLAIYFAVLVLWRIVSGVADGEPLAATAVAVGWHALLGAAAGGVLGLLAWASARTATYAITTKRVVMRVGVALPMTVNLPLRRIESAALRAHPDGTGDIPLKLRGDDRVAWLHLWPHVRAWRLARPEPMLRAVPEAGRVAEILAAAALAAVPGASTAPAHPERAPAPRALVTAAS
jgi:Bacterial PH domain